MIAIVITFAVVTMLFEAILLWKFATARWLTATNTVNIVPAWAQKVGGKPLSFTWSNIGTVHLVAILANLIVHWGTIVGTMTAISAGLVSFITVPVVLFLIFWRENYVIRVTSCHSQGFRAV